MTASHRPDENSDRDDGRTERTGANDRTDRAARTNEEPDASQESTDSDSDTNTDTEPEELRASARSVDHPDAVRKENGDPTNGPGAPDAERPGDQGLRLHPISLPYRILQAGFGFVPIIIVLGLFLAPILGPIGPIVAIVASILGLILIIGWQVAYYQRFEYQATETTFDIRSGVISRRHREIPYHRIQNVDISRNLVQRGLDIAQLNIETAGGSETEAALRYVGYDEAKRLQNELRDRKRRAEREESEDEAISDKETQTERLLYEITPKDLFILAIASVDLRLLSILGVVLTIVSPPFLVEFIATMPVSPVIIIVILVVILAIISGIFSGANAIINTYGFTLTQWGNELRYERGLIQRYDGSIPLDKVQTLAFRENVLKRLFEYSTLAIETAGYAPGSSDTRIGSESAVPIARREQVWTIGRDIEPFGEIDLKPLPSRARTRYIVRYELALVILGGVLFGVTRIFDWTMYWSVLIIAIFLAPIAAHYKWKHRGYQLKDQYIITQNGYWNQVTRIVPVSRIQTVIETQTVFQRRWRLGTVTIDTAGTSSLIGGDAIAYDIDQTDAAELRETTVNQLHDVMTELSREVSDQSMHEGDPSASTANEKQTHEEAPPSDRRTEDNDSHRSGDSSLTDGFKWQHASRQSEPDDDSERS